MIRLLMEMQAPALGLRLSPAFLYKSTANPPLNHRRSNPESRTDHDARGASKNLERLMAELKKSGTAAVATSQVDPAKTNTRERPAAEQGNVALQDAKKLLTSRAYTAVLVRQALDKNLQKQGFSLHEKSSPWLTAKPDDKASILLRQESSFRHWAKQELKSFASAAQRTPEEIKAAKEQLKVRAFGAQILLAQKGVTPIVGWLKLPPEVRKDAGKDFDRSKEEWVSKELRQYAARKWDRSRPKQSSSDRAQSTTQDKSRSSAKGAADSDKDSSPSR